AEQAHDDHAHHEERGGDRAPDERLGDIHACGRLLWRPAGLAPVASAGRSIARFAASRRAAARASRFPDLHVRTRLELVLTIDDHALAGLEAAIDQCLALLAGADFHGANLDGFVAFDHEDKCALRTALHDRGRHDQTVLAHREEEPG